MQSLNCVSFFWILKKKMYPLWNVSIFFFLVIVLLIWSTKYSSRRPTSLSYKLLVFWVFPPKLSACGVKEVDFIYRISSMPNYLYFPVSPVSNQNSSQGRPCYSIPWKICIVSIIALVSGALLMYHREICSSKINSFIHENPSVFLSSVNTYYFCNTAG